MMYKAFRPVKTTDEHKVNLNKTKIPNLLASLHRLEHLRSASTTHDHKHKAVKRPQSAIKRAHRQCVSVPKPIAKDSHYETMKLFELKQESIKREI